MPCLMLSYPPPAVLPPQFPLFENPGIVRDAGSIVAARIGRQTPPKRPGRRTRNFPTMRSLNDQPVVHQRSFQRGGAMTGSVRRHLGETGGLAGPRARKSVSLALHGGGPTAHSRGACSTPSSKRLAVEAITGASAGAMNAVVMVEGWLGRDRRGAEPARNLLAPGPP